MRKPLTVVIITLIIDCIGLGIILPIVPGLIQELTGENLSQAARYGGWLTFSYAAVQFLFAPIIGGLSDRFGRRPVILASLAGLGADYFFMAMAPSITWLFIGRILAGLFGASYTSAMAYIADISSAEEKPQNFGLVGVAFGLGFIIGPVIGGLFSEWGLRAPFIVAGMLSLANLVVGYWLLPESLSRRHRRRFEWKRANPLGALAQIKKYPNLFRLIFAVWLLYIAGQATQSTWTFYTMEKFQWTEKIVGYSLGLVGLVSALVQGLLIRKLIPLIGPIRSIYSGIILYMCGFLLFASATEGWMMFAFIIPYCLGGISGPALQGILSTRVPDNEQGELQGVMASMMSLSAIVGPVFMTRLFSTFTQPNPIGYVPEAPFLAAAVLTFIGLILCIRSLRHQVESPLGPAPKPSLEGSKDS